MPGDTARENGKKGGRPQGSKSAETLAREEVIRTRLYEVALTAERVLDELTLHAFSNVQDLFDEDGNLKPIRKLSREQAASIASLEVVKKNAEAGDGHTDVIHKVKVWDKVKTLEMLAKHFALLTDRLEVSVTDDYADKLAARRARQKTT